MEAIMCETSAEVPKHFTGTFVLQEKPEDMRDIPRCMSNNNTVNFTHSNSVFVVNFPLLVDQW